MDGVYKKKKQNHIVFLQNIANYILNAQRT